MIEVIFHRLCSRGEHRTRIFVLSCPVLLPTFVLAGGRTGQKPKARPVLQDRTSGPPVLCSALISTGFLVLSCFLPSSWRAAGQDKNKKRALSYRTGQDTRTACPVLSSVVFMLLRSFKPVKIENA